MLRRKSFVVFYRIAPEIVVVSIIKKKKRTGDRREHHALKRLSTDVRSCLAVYEKSVQTGANVRATRSRNPYYKEIVTYIIYILLPELGLIGVQGIMDLKIFLGIYLCTAFGYSRNQLDK